MTSIDTLHHAQSALIDSLNATGEQLERLGGHELTLALARVQQAAEQAKARMTSAVEQMHQVLADILEHVQQLTRGIVAVLEPAPVVSPLTEDVEKEFIAEVVEPAVAPTPAAHEPASIETAPDSLATPDAVDATAEASTTVDDLDDQPSLFAPPAPVPEVAGTAEIVSVAANTCVADPDTLAILPEDSGRPARRRGKSRR